MLTDFENAFTVGNSSELLMKLLQKFDTTFWRHNVYCVRNAEKYHAVVT